MLTRGMLLAVAFVSTASAQEPDSQAGQDLYMTYCWQCHGLDATGDGPMAEMLAIPTPNLTMLASSNAGVFPADDVAMKVDGRAPMLAHGGEMPIFGPVFDSDQSVALRLPSGQTLMTDLPLGNLLVYLETLQSQ